MNPESPKVMRSLKSPTQAAGAISPKSPSIWGPLKPATPRVSTTVQQTPHKDINHDLKVNLVARGADPTVPRPKSSDPQESAKARQVVELSSDSEYDDAEDEIEISELPFTSE